MNATRHRSDVPGSRRSPAAPGVVTVTIMLILTVLTISYGCATSPSSTAGVEPAASPAAVAGPTCDRQIVLRFDHGVALATLADTPAARELAGRLPITLELRDAMGQAKTGRLAAPLVATDAEPTTDPGAGGLYWVPDADLIDLAERTAS